VLARYLQTVCLLPSMSLLVTGNGTVSVVTLVLVIKRRKFFSLLRLKMLPLMILVTLIRVITNLLSPKFAMAVYVQLVTLAAPFMVALLNTLVGREKLPAFTIPALLLCTIGGSMMILSSIFPFKFTISNEDWLGIGLGGLSALFLALYMMLVKEMADNTKGEELLFFLTSPVVMICLLLSFIMEEDWSPWIKLDLYSWGVWIAFSFGVILLCNLLQISSIRVLGAPMVSTMIAFRLVSTLVFSAVMMDEELSDIFQFTGAFIVLGTVTGYMWIHQKKPTK